MGESLAVAGMLVEGGYADLTLAVTSSHFAGAEKQFRFPLGYGAQRPMAATWTVTGSGAVILASSDYVNKSKNRTVSQAETMKQAKVKTAAVKL